MKYDVVIGLEIHVELKTQTKCFCSCPNKFGSPVNTNVCPVCLGLPGALPSINKKCVEYCIMSGLAFNCEINHNAIMERKNYFYPDLPKGYQISQLEKPFCTNGRIELGDKVVRINNIHLEEDAGKNIHDGANGQTLVDFNRSGVPLIEIVTEPDLSSSDEAIMLLENIKETLTYIGVSDCKMQEGSLRCDVNVSLKEKGSSKLGTRSEMKNLNSFKAVKRAIEYEVVRQEELLNQGKKIVQETLKWDDEKGRNFSLRSKEEANDYKYFPDPDLLEISVSDEYIEQLKSSLPMLPEQRKNYYMKDLNLPKFDAQVLTQNKEVGDFFDECYKLYGNAKSLSNYIRGDILRKVKDELDLSEQKIKLSPHQLVEILKMIDDKMINLTSAKIVLDDIWAFNKEPKDSAKSLGLAQNNDESEIKTIVENVVKSYENAVKDYKNGNQKTLAFFVGQVMKSTKGKANPEIVNKIVVEILDNTKI